jgi:phosphate transport system substrate-binding protein
VGPARPDRRGADKPINPYGFNFRYHGATYFCDTVLKGSDKWNERTHMYTNYLKPDGTTVTAAEQVMASLGQDIYGIGYGRLGNQTAQTKGLAVAPDETHYVSLTIENVQNRTDPLVTTEYWYANRRPGQPLDPKVREFLRYTLSRQGQEEVERDGKFLPLTAEAAAAGLKRLD